MVTLLVSLSIASILMTATMPVWSQMAKREREEELVFRLGQYSRAIRLFQSRNGPGVLPPSIDVLVQQKHLRKKFKDPITGEDFEPVTALTQTTITPPGTGRGGGPPASATRPSPPPTSTAGRGANQAGGVAPGGLRGVVSSSDAESLRTLNGRTHYNEWISTEVPNSTQRLSAAGGNAPATNAPGQTPGPAGRGAPNTPGGRGPGSNNGGFNQGQQPGFGGSPFSPGTQPSSGRQGGSTPPPSPGGRR